MSDFNLPFFMFIVNLALGNVGFGYTYIPQVGDAVTLVCGDLTEMVCNKH